MQQIKTMVNQMIFDVEKNAQFALQVFNAYYRTPDPTGKIYAEFPEFFLINPNVLDVKELTIHSQEKKLLEECKLKAEARGGYIGITKYFDEKFGYHWIKLSVFPFELGDASDDSKSEFFYILNRFVEFTQKNPHVYGDLTAEIKTDNDIALMLHGIKKNGELLKSKLDLYSEAMLVSFNSAWPAAEVKKILATLEHNDQSWNQLFLEYLRYVMRKKAGISKKKEISSVAREKVGLDSNLHDSAVSIDHAANVASVQPVDLLVEQQSDIDQFLLFVECLQDAQGNQDLLILNEVTTPEPSLTSTAVVDELSGDKVAMQDLLGAAQARSLNILKVKSEAAHIALKAEENKVRVEALAVVALRKQADEADRACQIAMERIEQARKLRIQEEAEAHEMERTYVQSETMAADAARQRGIIANQAMQAAEQRQLLEMELLAKEQLYLEREQALQIKITQRLASVEQNIVEAEERVKHEAVSTQLVQEKLSTEFDASLNSVEPSSSESLGLAALDRAALIPSLSAYAKVSNPIALELIAYETADSTFSVSAFEGEAVDNPFAYEEQWHSQKLGGVVSLEDKASAQQIELPNVDSSQFSVSVRKTPKSLPLTQAFGFATMMMLVGFFGYPLVFSGQTTMTQVEPSKSISSPITKSAVNDLHHATLIDEPTIQNSEIDTPLTLGTLKMSDHLGLTLPPQSTP